MHFLVLHWLVEQHVALSWMSPVLSRESPSQRPAAPGCHTCSRRKRELLRGATRCVAAAGFPKVAAGGSPDQPGWRPPPHRSPTQCEVREVGLAGDLLHNPSKETQASCLLQPASSTGPTTHDSHGCNRRGSSPQSGQSGTSLGALHRWQSRALCPSPRHRPR